MTLKPNRPITTGDCAIAAGKAKSSDPDSDLGEKPMSLAAQIAEDFKAISKMTLEQLREKAKKKRAEED